MVEPRRRPKYKVGLVQITPGQPLKLVESKNVPLKTDRLRRKAAEQISSMIAAYVKAGHELLSGTYSGVKDLAPSYLSSPSKVYVVSCDDGVLIRYEPADDGEDHVFVGIAPDTIYHVAPLFTEFVVYCVPKDTPPTELDITLAPKIVLGVSNPTGDPLQPLAETQVAFVCQVDESDKNPNAALGKPFRLIGVENGIEFQMLAEERAVDQPDKRGRQFIARARSRLPVGWDYVEIYPNVDLKYWNKEMAHSWAETDILSWVMRRKLQDEQLRALDPNVDTRREFARLLDEYQQLLDTEPKEEVLQEFLAAHPLLLSPTHKDVWPKAAFGANVSDFVFRDAAGDYLLVEIEPSSERLFIKSGDTSARLKHAQNQILDWERYIEDNLRTVQDELGMKGISSSPASVIVIGRSIRLSDENRRKLVTIHNNTPRQRILTYDDVLANARATIENILGPLWAASGAADVYYLPVTHA